MADGVHDRWDSSPVAARSSILVVEDNPVLRRFYANTLVRFGYQIQTAGDGVEGWDLLRAGAFDLLITDYCMPKMSGLELTARVREHASEMPVLLISGTIPIQEIRRRPELRLSAILPKPFPESVLRATVRELLQPVKRTASMRFEPAGPGHQKVVEAG